MLRTQEKSAKVTIMTIDQRRGVEPGGEGLRARRICAQIVSLVRVGVVSADDAVVTGVSVGGIFPIETMPSKDTLALGIM